MVRFVPLIAAMLTLGIAAGAPLPSTPEGEEARLPVSYGKADCRIIVKSSGHMFLACVAWAILALCRG